MSRRALGPMTATFLVAGNMIGSGIYLLPATLAAFGSVSIIGWIISAIGALMLAFVFAGLFRVRPDANGLIAHVREGLGRYFGFQTSFIYWAACWIGNVAIALAVTGYLGALFPALRGTAPAALTTLGVLWLFTLLNLAGARRVAAFQGATLAIGLLPILLAVAFGWLRFDPAVFMESWNVSGRSDAAVIPATFVSIFWAFLGLESAAICAAVVRNPARDVPIAAVGGVTLAALVYIAASTALMGLMPAADLARSTAPFADAAARVIGPLAAAFVAVCAVLKASGTLSGWILATAESAYSAAESRVFPSLFAERAGAVVPRRNLVIIGVLMSAVVFFTLSPTLAAQFTIIVNVSTLLFLLVYIYCCIALWRFSAGASPAMRWVWRGLALAALVFCAWAIAASEPLQLAYAGAIVAITAPLYWLARPRQSSLEPST